MKFNNRALDKTQRNDVEEIGNLKDDTQAMDEQGEFKISVRRLQIPVRPRGVLAE